MAKRSKKKIRERKNLYNKIYRARKKLEKLRKSRRKDKTTVNAQFKKVNSKIIHLRNELREKNKQLEVKVKKKFTREELKIVELAPTKNFETDPGSPYLLWEAWRNFDAQISNLRWEWFIINGRRMSTKDRPEIEFEAQKMFGEGDDYEFYYEVSINPDTNTIKYDKK